MSKRQGRKTYKMHNSGQLNLHKLSLGEFTVENHVIRVTRDVLDRINIDSIVKK